MGVGGCCPLCPRYLLVLLTLFATSKGFLRVVNSLDLFIRQHICIDGGGFERLVSHQLLGCLNVAGNRLRMYVWSSEKRYSSLCPPFWLSF